jgi:peptidoglycan hydrolase CwlO-like protein
MDSNLLVAIVTSITTASSTAGVAITALMLSNKRIDRVEARLDRVEAGLEKIHAALEMLTGSLHDIDKRLSIIEDRVGRSGG